MKKLNAAIAALVVLIVLTAFYGATAHKAAKEIDIALEDAATYSFLELDRKLYDNKYREGSTDFYNANLFFNADTLQVQASPVLKPFDTENNDAKDLVTYVNRISLGRGLGYQDIFDRASDDGGMITDYRYAFMDTTWSIKWNKTNDFGTYYHSLFKTKNARAVLFNEALGIVAGMAQKYPGDFRKRLLTEIDSLVAFTKSLAKRKYSEAKYFNAYWEGFIYRRHFVDKVPATEIEQSLRKARNTIAALKPSNDHAYKVTFNGEFTVYASAGSFILSSAANKKELAFNGGVEEVKYIRGKGYQVSYTDKSGKPVVATYTAQLKKV